MSDKWRILVLQGGPDREAGVSRKSAGAIASALERAGHEVVLREIGPDDLSALEVGCDVVFPALHGAWGEGGALQQILEGMDVPFVGCRAKAARLAMDKVATKRIAQKLGLYTPMWQVLHRADELTLEVPLVIKPVSDGSSFGVRIVREIEALEAARGEVEHEFERVFAERLIEGREMTVGVIGEEALPPIWIRPATEYYDFDAKYDREDTVYEFDAGLHEEIEGALKSAALAVHEGVGARHLSRVDFILDEENRPWLLEINTMPGFTDHSLVPKAAAKAGMTMEQLCERLVAMALG